MFRCTHNTKLYPNPFRSFIDNLITVRMDTTTQLRFKYLHSVQKMHKNIATFLFYSWLVMSRNSAAQQPASFPLRITRNYLPVFARNWNLLQTQGWKSVKGWNSISKTLSHTLMFQDDAWLCWTVTRVGTLTF